MKSEQAIRLINKIDNLIRELDSASGMLLVVAMKDSTVKRAMEKVAKVSFELGDIIDDLSLEKMARNEPVTRREFQAVSQEWKRFCRRFYTVCRRLKNMKVRVR